MNSATAWSLREANKTDEAFFCVLYASTRIDEEPIRHWPQTHKNHFLALQFEAQRAYYTSRYPAAEWRVICTKETDTGRLILSRSTGDIRIVDITLLPSFRGKGLGASIIWEIIKEADNLGATVSLSVTMDNPARRLYERLGFREIPGGTPPYLQLRREVAKS